MPRSVRKISVLACLLLVVLRVSIGWQFLYEGLWKLGTQKTSKPWSAEGYLVNATGPFREKFRSLVDDPDGIEKLNFETVSQSWDDWRNRFVAHYANTSQDNLKLAKAQENSLANLLDGPAYFSQPLAELPPGVDLAKFKPIKYKAPKGWFFRYNAKAKRLETNLHLVPEERDALLRMVEAPADDAQAPLENSTSEPAGDEQAGADADSDASAVALDPRVVKFRDAIKKLYTRSSQLCLRERLQVLLQEDAERIGLVQEKHAGTIDHQRPGKKQVYEHLLERYNHNLDSIREARAFLPFRQEHLDKQWREIVEKKAELVGPVDALTAEFKNGAYKLLSVEQSALGPVPEPLTRLGRINLLTMWALTILGITLIVGFLTRLSALGAAGLLLLFYLPMPPWPGVPEAPGPEHSLIVNKNLIECVACLALASLPTGRWIGIDAFIRRFILFRKTD